MDEDRAGRSGDIHWPDDFSPDDAELFTHNEVHIRAPRSTVWQHLVAAGKWLDWYPNAHNVRILDGGDGTLREDTRFEWEPFGFPVRCRVGEFVPESRLAWFGEGTDLKAYHAWLLTDEPDGCYVLSEEAARGTGALGRYQSDPDGLHKAHDLWNIRLKRLSETGSPLGRAERMNRRQPSREAGPVIRER